MAVTVLRSVAFRRLWDRRVRSGFALLTTQKLDFLREHIEVGRTRSVVEKEFPLSDTAMAHRYYERGRLKSRGMVTVV